MTAFDDSLSAAGRARREAILNAALEAARVRRRQRRMARVGAVGCALGAVGLLIYVFPQESRHDAGVTPGPGPAIVAVDQPPLSLVQIIPPDPTVLDRLVAPERPPTWRSIDDDTLLAALAEAGEPSGLVEIDGQTLLVAHTALP